MYDQLSKKINSLNMKLFSWWFHLKFSKLVWNKNDISSSYNYCCDSGIRKYYPLIIYQWNKHLNVAGVDRWRHICNSTWHLQTSTYVRQKKNGFRKSPIGNNPRPSYGYRCTKRPISVSVEGRKPQNEQKEDRETHYIMHTYICIKRIKRVVWWVN